MNHHDYDHHHHHCCRRHHHQNYQETPFSNDSYPLALTYINWETDAIVGIELIRNVSMALGDTIIITIIITTIIIIINWETDVIVNIELITDQECQHVFRLHKATIL